MSSFVLRLALVAALVAAVAVAIEHRPVLVTTMPGRSFDGLPPPPAPALIELAGRLEAHVRTLSEDIGERNMFRYAALRRAADYIDATFRAAGHEPRSQAYHVEGLEVRNVEVDIPGTTPEAGLVVVGAHYDSVRGSPGANDNATGVAALLELARSLRGRRLRRDLRLIAFVNEEPPFHMTGAMGSMRSAARSAQRGEKIVAMLSLETIGYYSDEPGSQGFPFPLSFFYADTGNFIGFVGNLGSAALVRRVTASFRRHARFPSQGLAAPGWIMGVGWSDHQSFWRQGFPAVMVTDTALFRYGQYHTVFDRPDVVDYERLARVVDGLLAVVVDLAGGEVRSRSPD